MAYPRVRFKQIIRQRCDLENTTFETDIELNDLINDCAADLHDLLISAAGSRYALGRATLSTTAGTSDYQLAISDFYKLVKVSLPFDDMDYPLGSFEREDSLLLTTSRSWGPGYLPRYHFSVSSASEYQLRFNPPPDSVKTINLDYHTQPPVYETDADPIAIPYSHYLIVEACIRIKDKEERDTTRLERERAMIQKRIEDWGATFDQANPPRTLEAPGKFSRATWRRERIF